MDACPGHSGALDHPRPQSLRPDGGEAFDRDGASARRRPRLTGRRGDDGDIVPGLGHQPSHGLHVGADTAYPEGRELSRDVGDSHGDVPVRVGLGAEAGAYTRPMKTLILCGGMGTRAYPHTTNVPKPLMHVGGVPVLLHLMHIYAEQGFTDFVLAGGYKYEMLEQFAGELDEPWTVTVVDTGLETNTGGRVAKAAPHLPDESFFCTYADGLGDVDLKALLEFHRSHTGRATLTCVPLPSQYGTLVLDATGRVDAFKEKPRLPDHLINAGYFVFDRSLLDGWPGEDLERDVLPELGGRGDLFAYRHDGFWKSMDTYKDSVDLTALADDPPWRR